MDSELAAFDIDDCIDQDGSIHAWALALIKRCNTYAEITPSGERAADHRRKRFWRRASA